MPGFPGSKAAGMYDYARRNLNEEDMGTYIANRTAHNKDRLRAANGYGSEEESAERVDDYLPPERRLPGLAGGQRGDDAEMERALEEDLGYAQPRANKPRTGTAPGIYTPNADGSMATVKTFERPERRNKFAGQLAGYSKDQKEQMLRKRRGLPEPVRDESEELMKTIAMIEKLGGGAATAETPRQKMPELGTPGPRSMGPELPGATALLDAAKDAPAVANLGGGGRMDAPAAAGGGGAFDSTMKQQLIRQIMAKKLGVDLPDPRKIADEDEERAYKKKVREIGLKKAERESRSEWDTLQEDLSGLDSSGLDEQTKRAMRMKKTGIDPEAMQFEGAKRKAEMGKFEREQTGTLSPVEQRQARADALQAVQVEAQELRDKGIKSGEAFERAKLKANLRLKAYGVPELAPDELAAATPKQATGAGAVGQKLMNRGFTDEADAWRKIVDETQDAQIDNHAVLGWLAKVPIFGWMGRKLRKGLDLSKHDKHQINVTKRLMDMDFSAEEAAAIAERGRRRITGAF